MNIKFCENCGKEHDGTYASGRFCNKSCSKSFIAKQVKNRKNNLPNSKIDLDKLYTTNIKEKRWQCSYCGECFGTRNLLFQHTKENHASFDENGKRLIWNKGLTCETSTVMKQLVAKKVKRYRDGELIGSFKGRHHSSESKKLISQKLSINNKGGRCKWYTVNGQKVQGTWEKSVAEVLTLQGIKWSKIRTHELSHKYIDNNGKTHTYTPDFYLPDYNLVLEVKGHWWGNDKQKMKWVREQNPNSNIVIIDKDIYENIVSNQSIDILINNENLLLDNYIF